MTTAEVSAHRQQFALVDCNNFYCSCERALNPKLDGVPMVVLSNNDGCAVARSNEVKALGVKMGTPWFQMKDLAKEHGIVAMSSNYTLYGDMSNRVVSILREYSPNIEVYSIDESFVLLNGMQRIWRSPTEMGQHIRRRIFQWTNLPVCVGIGASKTLAKLANHIAKKNPKFNSVCDLNTLNEIELKTLFKSIGVGEVWGVGRQILKKLEDMNIGTVQALKEASVPLVRSHFGVVMERTVNELNGISCLELEELPASKKQIVSSKSFGQLVLTIDELNQAAATYMTRAAEKLRHQQSVAGAIQVHVRTNPFRTQDKQYSNGMVIPLPEPTNDTRILIEAVLFGLKHIYRPGFWYKKVGVMLLDLSDAKTGQGTLFSAYGDDNKRSAALMRTIDSLNQKMGTNTLVSAASGIQKNWAMRSENKSPRYTTCWHELPIAFAR
jgi:DNA polymerase V